MQALVAHGDLNLIKNQRELLDPTFKDPLGHNILHSARYNSQEVFYYIAEIFPELLNTPNLHGITPIYDFISSYGQRIEDWDKIWKLPIKLSMSIGGGTLLTRIQNDYYAVKAFEALIQNEYAWKKARKHHKRKILLTKALHGEIERWKDYDTSTTSVLAKKVEFFVQNGNIRISKQYGINNLVSGASIHHHEGKSLLNTAAKRGRVQTVIKLLQLGNP
jgi:hypothetical protein